MDPAKFRAWVVKQIEEHGVCGTPSVATRLADAAAVIRDARPGMSLFGMSVPESGPATAPPSGWAATRTP